MGYSAEKGELTENENTQIANGNHRQEPQMLKTRKAIEPRKERQMKDDVLQMERTMGYLPEK